jgi:murein DD-endopeptidase MepM/ murein hydrolase activator NlpD
VTYGHLYNAVVPFGTRVSAGNVVAVSGTLLHVGVRYRGEELDPMPFLTMVYGNMKMFTTGIKGIPDIDTVELDVPTFRPTMTSSNGTAFISLLFSLQTSVANVIPVEGE